MARLSASTLRTVRFYEEAGILEPLERTPGGHRLFAHEELVKLKFAGDLRHAGLSLEEVRSFFATKAEHNTGAEAALALSEKIDKQLALVESQVQLLQQLALELSSVKSALRGCASCKDTEHFPDHCGDCAVMRAQEQVPKALQVLWGVQS